MRKLNKEKAEVGKERCTDKRERVELQRRCWKHVTGDSLEDFNSVTEWEVDGLSFGVFRCVCLLFLRL